MTVSWFVKVVRSGARYEDGSLPAEVWREYEVCPTLNAFDNGDTRATTIIFYGNRVADIRVQDDKINTLQARMGTGGNNMPMVATFGRKAMLEEDWQQSNTGNTLRR